MLSLPVSADFTVKCKMYLCMWNFKMMEELSERPWIEGKNPTKDNDEKVYTFDCLMEYITSTFLV